MDMNILYAIQGIRTGFLDSFFVVFGNVVGSKGQLWVYIGILLLIIPKTRKCGLCLLCSYLLAYFIPDALLKDIIARPRPCSVDTSVVLLCSKPSSFSCPSVHSCLAFASAVSIFHFYKKAGTLAILLAVLIVFSRLYFFVHYPTDVLFGAVLGSAIAILVCNMAFKKSMSAQN